MFVGKLFGDSVNKILRGNSVLGIATVYGVAGKGGMVAKIFSTAPAELAGAVGAMQPGDADARAEGKPGCAGSQLLNDSNDLVTRNYRRFLRNQFPFNDMKIGAADTATRDANQDFAISGRWSGIVLEH